MTSDREPRYDAFISYSHAVDSRLAPNLQTGLEGFAKKWYSRRALRTFRDKTGLSATPALWPAIERALDESKHFVLLASPESAASPWVQREVTWWLEHRSARTILIVLTSGELVWDSLAGDFHQTRASSIPSVLRGRFAEEPLYVDLRWARDEQQLSLRHSKFRAAVVDLAAALHGRPRDELDGDDLREHRRFKAAAWTAVCALTILAIVSATAAYVAVRNARLAEARRVEAEQQRSEAERQRDLAIARQLTAESNRMVLEHPLDFELAALLTAASLRRAYLFENDLAARERLELLPRSSTVLNHGAAVLALALSSDGRYMLTGGADGVVRRWHRDTGAEASRFRHGSPIWAVTFAANGRRVFTAGADGAIREWNTETGQSSVAVSFEVHPGELDLVAFSSDGTRAATVYTAEDFGATIQIWDLVARNRRQLIRFGQVVTSISLDPYGRRLLGGTWAKSVHMWNSENGEEILRFDTSDRVEEVAFSTDGTHVVTATSDRMVRIWPAVSGGREVASFRHPSGITRLGLHGRRVLTGAPESAALFDADSGSELVRASHGGPVRAVAFSLDGRTIATASDDGTARVWLSQAGKYAQRQSCGSTLSTLFFNADGRHVSESGGVVLVGGCTYAPANDGGISATTRLRETGVGVLSADRRFLATVGDSRRLAINDLATGATIVSDLTILGGSLWGLAISRDGRHVAAVSGSDGWRGRVEIWESAGGRSTATFNYPRDGLYSIAFSPDGRRVVVGTGAPSLLDAGEARVLDLATSQQLTVFKLGGGRPRTVSYSPDGRRLLTASEDGTATIWDAESGRKQVTVTQGGVLSAASWSDDGTQFATASVDGLAQVWDATTGDELVRIRHRHPVLGVAFSPDGGSLVTATQGFVEFHGLRPATLVQQVCDRIRRDFTPMEWRRYFGAIAVRPTCENVP